jgi:hypothetical protein
VYEQYGASTVAIPLDVQRAWAGGHAEKIGVYESLRLMIVTRRRCGAL